MPMNPINFAKMSRLLVQGTTSQQIVEETGIHITTVRNYLRELHQTGVTFVYDWAPDPKGTPNVRIFKFKEDEHDIDMACPVSEETFSRYPKNKQEMLRGSK